MKKQFFLTLTAMLFFLSQVSYSYPDWESLGKGANNELATVNTLTPLGLNLYAGTADGLYKYTQENWGWVEIDNGISDKSIKGIALKGTDIYVITATAGVFKSIDDGVTWTEINKGLTFKETNQILINGEDIYIGTNGGVFLSNNNGDSWTDLSNGLIAEQKRIASIAVIGNNLFIGTFKEGILVTSDKGANWKTVNTGLDYNWVQSMGVIDNTLIAAVNDETKSTGCGVYISNNFGEAWTKTNNYFFSDDQISSLTIANGKLCFQNAIIIGTNSGKISWTDDYGVDWTNITYKLPKAKLISIVYTDTNALLYASYENEGIFSNFTIGAGIETRTNREFSVTPNPTSDFITISVGAINPMLNHGVDAATEINIYNTLGEKMMTVEQTFLSVQQISISNLPKGIYFVKVGAETAKFVKM